MSAQRSTMVDWDLAVTTATRMAGPGPTVARSTAEEAVEELRAGSLRSTPLVREFTGLMAPQGAPPGTERTAPVLVVDRQGWIQANVDGFATIVSPLIDRLQEKKGSPGPIAEAIGSRVTGVELGALLGFMSSRVLGQFDPFYAPEGSPGQPAPAGRMLLVAPNVVHVEGELGVDPTDFRLWVCLHEETHRAQFMANPWLRGHMVERSRALVEDLLGEPGAVVDRLTAALRHLPDLVRSGEAAGTGLIELVQTPEQRRALAELTAVMSLLEGHADVVMDDVGPQVVPSVAEIRRKFTRRRAGRGALDQLLRRLLGLEAKMRQYADGAVFVRTVVDKVGMESFNAVWTSAETLPAPEEIADPGAWVRRVHG